MQAQHRVKASNYCSESKDSIAEYFSKNVLTNDLAWYDQIHRCLHGRPSLTLTYNLTHKPSTHLSYEIHKLIFL